GLDARADHLGDKNGVITSRDGVGNSRLEPVRDVLQYRAARLRPVHVAVAVQRAVLDFGRAEEGLSKVELALTENIDRKDPAALDDRVAVVVRLHGHHDERRLKGGL